MRRSYFVPAFSPALARRIAPALALALTMGACAPDATTAPATPSLAQSRGDHVDEGRGHDLNVARADLLATDARYAAAAAGHTTLDALAAAWAPDVYYLLGGFPVAHGADAARATLARLPIIADGSISWRAVKADISSDLTLGYTFGYVDRTFADGSDHPGEYIAAWRRQADGDWKIAALVVNGRVPGPIDESVPAGFGTPTYKHYDVFPHATRESAIADAMATDRAFSDAGYPDLGAAFGAFAAPDVGTIGNFAITWSPESVRALFGPANPNRKLEWGPIAGDAAGTGDLAFTIGLARTHDMTRAGEPVISSSKYLTLWKRQPDGSFRYVMDGGNAVPLP